MSHTSQDFISIAFLGLVSLKISCFLVDEIYSCKTLHLIGHVDFHLFSPWVAWLSSFQSSFKSIHPPKMGELRPRFLSPYGMKLRCKNQNKESELNTVNREFICIGHLANTPRIYFKNARQNVLQEEVNVLINGRVLHYILTTNISTMLLNKQLLVIKLSTGWLSETIYC